MSKSISYIQKYKREIDGNESVKEERLQWAMVGGEDWVKKREEAP